MTKLFSWTEIFKHRSTDDLWLVVKGKVYDVTSWVPHHPGGDLILSGAGREATALFLSYHPLHVEKMIAKYEIGEVENYNPYYRWDDSDFFPKLKRRVETHLKEKGLEKDFTWMYIKSLIIVFAWISCYYFSMIKGSILLAFVFGFVQSHIGLSIAHDGNHGSFSRSKFLNNLAAHGMDFIGASSIVWKHQHNIGHHPNCNRQGDSCMDEGDMADPDTRSGSPIVRLTPGQPFHWYHRFQHIYFWILLCMFGIKWALTDFKHFAKHSYLNVDFFRITSWDLFILFVAKTVFFIYLIVVPFVIHPFWKALILTCCCQVVGCYMLVLSFAVNHLSGSSIYPDGNITNRNWARLQVETSTNFGVGSSFWTWMSGGLNYQIEHHLFPYISHVHLQEISPIVQQTCKEYDIPYNNFVSYFDALISFFHSIKNLGNPKEA